MSYRKVELLPELGDTVSDNSVTDSEKYSFGHAKLMHIMGYNDGDIFFDAIRNSVHYLSRPLFEALTALEGAAEISDLRETTARYGLDTPAFLEMMRSGLFSNPGRRSPGHNYTSIPSILFSPSAGCNLACSYCYSEAVIKHEYIQKDCYDIAIRKTIEGVRNKKDYFLKTILGERPKIRLGIIGGGEPTLNPSLFIDIIKTFKRECEDAGIEPVYSAISNGTFGDNVLQVLIENQIEIMISIDGYAEVQNTQRPFHDGSGTFHIVIDNIRKLVQGGCFVTMRSTVTRGSLPHMMDIVHLAREESLPVIHIEPLGLSGRALTSGAIPPEPTDFCRGFADAFIAALKNGIAIKSNQFPLALPYRETFCGACGTNRIITTEGYVSTCTEVTDIHSSLSDTFIIGKVNREDRRIDLWQDRLDSLGSRTLKNMQGCDQCFLRFNCAGNCPAKSLRKHGDINKPVQEWCEASRALSIQIISTLFDEQVSNPG